MPIDREEFSEDTELTAWRARRDMDRELISAISRMSKIEKDMERVNIAVFGFHGDNGIMGKLGSVDGKLDRLDEKLSARTGELHTKIDEKMTWVYRALVSAALTFVVAAASFFFNGGP